MKKRLISMLLLLCMTISFVPTVALAADTKLSAAPSKTNFVMGSKPVSVTQAYNVTQTNYLQLRAIAELLNGTAAQFNVGWDGTYAVIETGKPYSATATETALRETTNVRTSTTKFKVDGKVVSFDAALLIDGDTNYLQLREFAQKLSGTASQFNVYWDSTAAKAVIEPGAAYTGRQNVSLYRVAYDNVPYRESAGGDIIGLLPYKTNLEVTAIEGDWAKFKYRGNTYFLWANKIEKIDAPDIVCSNWAKEWFNTYNGSYIGTAGEWTGAKEDWTKPITREDMALMLVDDIMVSIYGNWAVKFTLPGAFRGADELQFDDQDSIQYWFEARRLLYWGIVPDGKFNPQAQMTYGEFTNCLIKLMAYDKKMLREGGGLDFTKATIEKFAIGGNTNANSIITKEQATVLCQKTLCWWYEMSNASSAKYEQNRADTSSYSGSTSVGTGVYTIKTLIGKKPNQPHLVINAEGKGELNNTKTQNFKITYKKCVLNNSGEYMLLYTIQTLDGKYLALSGTPTNGSRLITRNTEYLWCIESAYSEDYQWTSAIYSPENVLQPLNASGWKTDDGNPVITWYWDITKESLPRNCAFILDYVK